MSTSIRSISLGVILAASLQTAMAPRALAGALLEIELDDVPSFGLPGDSDNFEASIDAASALGLAPSTPLTIVSVGWDVNLSAAAPSWLADAIALFTNSAGDLADSFAVRPAAASPFPGQDDFSSGGQIFLADVGLPDLVLADGVFLVEFFEDFEDFPGFTESLWRGSITLGFEEDAPRNGSVTLDPDGRIIPLPSAAGLGLAGLGVLVAPRRRRAA